MAKRMTIVFDDVDLYTALKVEAARNHRPAKDIVATALALYFAATAEEQDSIIARARRPQYRPAPEPGTARALEELGFTR
jgi:hypothetical protein